MSPAEPCIREEIYEPFGGAARWIVRVIVPLQLAVVGVTWMLFSYDASIVFICVVFLCVVWLASELFVLWYRRCRRQIFLFGEPADAVVVAKRSSYRGGYWRLTIEFDAHRRRVRTSSAMSDRTALNHNVGDRLRIRYAEQDPRWWVPYE